MGKRTTFGKNPERLSRLLALGLDQCKDQKAKRPSEVVTLHDFTGEQPGTQNRLERWASACPDEDLHCLPAAAAKTLAHPHRVLAGAGG